MFTLIEHDGIVFLSTRDIYIMTTYKVYLTNFGNVIYEGMDLTEAVEKAKSAGLESTMIIIHPAPLQNIVKTYSPISGWR
jgi:hypothetical protein